jgi:hypothetical protein
MGLIDDAKRYDAVRAPRRPGGVTCPRCSSDSVIKNGNDGTQPHRQRHPAGHGDDPGPAPPVFRSEKKYASTSSASGP